MLPLDPPLRTLIWQETKNSKILLFFASLAKLNSQINEIVSNRLNINRAICPYTVCS